MKTTLVTLVAGLALLGCEGNDDVSAAAPKPRAELVVQYEGNPSFRTKAKLFVKVIAPDDAIVAGGKVDDLSTDERILALREPELIGYYVAASRTRDVALEPQCGRMFNVEKGEAAKATISLPSLARAESCHVSR